MRTTFAPSRSAPADSAVTLEKDSSRVSEKATQVTAQVLALSHWNSGFESMHAHRPEISFFETVHVHS